MRPKPTLGYRSSCKFRARRRPEHNVPPLQVPGRPCGRQPHWLPKWGWEAPASGRKIPHRSEWMRAHSLRLDCDKFTLGCTTSTLWVPPTPRNDNAIRDDFTVAAHVLPRHVDVVELALSSGKDRGIADASRLEAAELGPLQCRRGVDGGRRNDIAERHSHAKKLRESRHLIEGRAVDAERVDVRGNRVRIKAVCEHAARRLERKRA